MKLDWVRALDVATVGSPYTLARLCASIGPYALGLAVEPWGLRLMLGVGHVCWHWRG